MNNNHRNEMDYMVNSPYENPIFHKPYQKLTFTDDYMFCRIMQSEPELCRKLIELLIGRPVEKVESIDSQKSISINSDIKSVRFDVYLRDKAGTVIDLEMQVIRRPELPKRSRYYQSVNDIDHLSRGMNYGRLPESYVIFICMFDPFQDEMPRYEFRELCRENPEIELNDGTHKVFINAKYVKTDISDEMRALFDYLCGKEPASELTQEIDASIIRAKRERRWERDYVQFIEKLEEAEMAGRKAMAELNLFLIEQDRIEDLKKASEEPDYLEAVFDEMRAAGRIDTDRSE
jgi:predicted transposase/invertase (TIGR01784 family)